MANSETLEGFVVDIACIRKYPRSNLFHRAQSHTRACALMGHCIESGYGLIDEQGLTLLDSHATSIIVQALFDSNQDCGIRMRVERALSDGEMRTVHVEVVPGSQD